MFICDVERKLARTQESLVEHFLNGQVTESTINNNSNNNIHSYSK